MTTTAILVGVAVLLALLWLLSKLAFRVFKYALLVLVLVGAGVAAAWYRMQPPPKPAGIGKHAYLTATGKYLGVVEGQGDDPRRGAVWIVRLPGSHPSMYSKARLTLKDQRDLASEPTPEPTATPTPATKNKPAPAANRKK